MILPQLLSNRGLNRFVPTQIIAAVIALIGDSMISPNFSGGCWPHLLGMAAARGYSLKCVANSGFNGRTLAQLSTEIGNDYDTDTAPGFEGLPPLGIGVMQEGTGQARGTDPSGGNPITQTDKDYYVACADEILARAQILIVMSLPPLGGITLGNKSVVIAGWNAYLRDELCARYPGRAFYLDGCQNLQTEAGAILPQFYYPDEGHLNDAGCYQRATDLVTAFLAILAGQSYPNPLVTDPAHVYPAFDQWCNNPTNTGTSGSFGSGWSGTAPTGVNVSGNGAGTGGAVSKTAADPGESNQTPWIEIEPSASASGSNIAVTFAAAGRVVTSSDPSTLQLLLEVELVGFKNHQGLDFWMQANSGGAINKVVHIGWGPDSPVSFREILRQEFWRSNASASGSTVTIFIYIAGGNTASGAMGSIKLRNISVEG